MDKRYALRIKVHTDIEYSVVVRTGYKPGGNVLVPKEKDLFDLPRGIYNVLFEATGFCSQEHLVLVDGEDNKEESILDIYPIAIVGQNAEFKGSQFFLPDAFESALYYDEVGKIAKEYPFNTPGFNEKKGALLFTESSEFREYINESDKVCSNIKAFHEDNISIVLISSEAENISDDLFTAADQIRRDDKLNIMYQAQVHGTEPASGEGALAFINEAGNGSIDDIIDKVNIWVIPCCNPVGTDRFERECRGININRDALNVECRETKILHEVFFRVMPEVVIDAHTFTRANGINSPHLDRSVLDIRISPAQSKNIDKDINKITADITEKVIKDLRKDGVRSGYYGDSADPSTSRVFYGLFNTCSFLLESEGSRSGKLHFERNVWCQLYAIKTLLKRISCNAGHIKTAVAEARERLLHQGSSIFVLKHGKSEKRFFKTMQASYDLAGNIVEEKNVIYFPKRAITLKKTTRPNIYILPKAEKKTEASIRLLRKHGVEIVEENDRYIVSTKQIMSNIISTILEPLSGDAEHIITQDK